MSPSDIRQHVLPNAIAKVRQFFDICKFFPKNHSFFCIIQKFPHLLARVYICVYGELVSAPEMWTKKGENCLAQTISRLEDFFFYETLAIVKKKSYLCSRNEIIKTNP